MQLRRTVPVFVPVFAVFAIATLPEDKFPLVRAALIEVSRFRIDHPTRENIHAIYGHDHMLGFFAEVFREGREKPLKSLDLLTARKPITLADCLDFFIDHGFFTREDLEQALILIQDGHPEPLPPGVAKTVDVVVRFKGSAGG